MMHTLLVGAGGFIGSILRYGLSSVAQRWVQDSFPLGTLVVNVIGCVIIGAFWSFVEYGGWFKPEARVFVVTGILGGFTTFSAFGYETFVLLRDRQYLLAGVNMSANVVVGIAAVLFGWMAAKFFVV